MTIPKNVQDAISRINHCELHSFDDDWLIIRAHLLSQDAEIARKEQEWHEMFDRALLAESRLAAANALLSEAWGFMNNEGIDWFDSKEDCGLLERIQSHLQGSGDEA